MDKELTSYYGNDGLTKYSDFLRAARPNVGEEDLSN